MEKTRLRDEIWEESWERSLTIKAYKFSAMIFGRLHDYTEIYHA